MGSGSLINKEYDRYEREGKKVEDHFRKEILFDFATFKEMNDKEREIVNEDFVADPRTYNRILGGSFSGQYNNGCLIIEHEGQKHTLAEWEAILGIDREIIRQRYKKGMTMQQIIDIPPRERDKIWFMLDGEGHTIYEWVKISGLDYNTLRRRLVDLKMSVEEAVTKPKAEPKRYPYKGQMLTMQQLVKMSGLSAPVISARMNSYKWSVERAVDTPLMPNPISIWEQKFEWNGGSYTIEELVELSGGTLFKQTIHDRIRAGWDMDRIMSTPSPAFDSRKKLYDYHGKKLTIEEGAALNGMSVAGLQLRMSQKKMSFEEAVDMPMLRHRNQLFEFNGESHTINEWAKIKGIPHMIIRQRMRNNGVTFEQAITTPYYKGKGMFRKVKANSKHTAQ